jgi:sugar-specific transcriptional regulator TrmB
MIRKLEERGFIRKTPGAPRSIELVIPRDMIPDLD